MIFGAFDREGRPYIRGEIAIPRLEVKRHVTFLIDTGADGTCIHPEDARRAGVPFDRLVEADTSSGIGGRAVYFREPAVVSFVDEKVRRLYAVELLIAEPTAANAAFPSLLGREKLNRWRMDYDPAHSLLEFTVRSADHTMN